MADTLLLGKVDSGYEDALASNPWAIFGSQLMKAELPNYQYADNATKFLWTLGKALGGGAMYNLGKTQAAEPFRREYEDVITQNIADEARREKMLQALKGPNWTPFDSKVDIAEALQARARKQEEQDILAKVLMDPQNLRESGMTVARAADGTLSLVQKPVEVAIPMGENPLEKAMGVGPGSDAHRGNWVAAYRKRFPGMTDTQADRAYTLQFAPEMALRKAEESKLPGMMEEAASLIGAGDSLARAAKQAGHTGGWETLRDLRNYLKGNWLGDEAAQSERTGRVDLQKEAVKEINLNRFPGALSNFEVNLLGSAAPGEDKSTETNMQIAEGRRAAGKRMQEFANFMTFGLNQGANPNNLRIMWQAYRDANPIAEQDPKTGRIVINANPLPWQTFLVPMMEKGLANQVDTTTLQTMLSGGGPATGGTQAEKDAFLAAKLRELRSR